MLKISLNGPIQVDQGKITPCSFPEKIKRFFSPSYDKKEIQATADHILHTIKNSEQPASCLALANAFVVQHAKTRNGDKISHAFDRQISALFPERQFLHSANQSSLAKWQRYGQDPAIYHRYPEFCSFMETSGLLSQIKVTRDAFQEIDGEPAIKVNGLWMKWPAFKEQFEVIFSEKYNEKFIVHNDGSVYTYLDNGKGLQPHHPFLTENTPTSIINDEDYAKVLATAHTFVREGEESLTPEERNKLNSERTFVLQLVSSYAKGRDTRVHNLTVKPEHPYLRIIIGRDNPTLNTFKGEVYEVGYVRKSAVAVPLTTTDGRFRSPDINEYKNFEQKVVTYMPVTAKEAKAFADYVADYYRGEVIGNPIGFHILKQNCTTFARVSLAEAGIQVPTEITVGELAKRTSPLWMASGCGLVKKLALETQSLAKRAISILPLWIKSPINWLARKVRDAVLRVWETLTALCFIPLKIALGDAFGSGGRAFIRMGGKPYDIEPNLKRFAGWFKLPSYKVNLPGILQNWQREQPSTVIYKNPVRLCIIPS